MRRSNSTGSVFKLKGKRRKPWAVRVTAGWTDDGKQIFKYLSYHEKKTDAKNALDAYNVNPYDIDAAKITFAEIYERWSKTDFETISDGTRNSYRSAYKHCKPLYDRVFKELRKSHLQAVVDAIKAPSMQNVAKIIFLKSYKYALENDIVNKNYAQFVTVAKLESKDKVPFTREEIDILWANVDEVKYADLVLILLYTGMRIGELLNMEKSNIFLEERYMIGGSKTKAGKNRIIPLHKRIVPLIEKRMNESDSKWLFINRIGAKLKYNSFTQYHWEPIIKLVGNDHTPHDTRHAFISEMSRLNVNQLVLKRIVGHSNASVTEHYTHLDLAELLEAVDKLE